MATNDRKPETGRVPQDGLMSDHRSNSENGAPPKRDNWVSAITRFCVVAIVTWTLLAMAISLFIPLDYPTEQADIDAAEPWVLAALVVGTLSLSTLDAVQSRRRAANESQNQLDAETSQACSEEG